MGFVTAQAQEEKQKVILQNKFQIELGMVDPSSSDSDTEYIYATNFANPMIRLDLGYEVYSKNKLSVVPKIGYTRGIQDFIRYSFFENVFVNFPDMDNVYARKRRVYSFINLSTEMKRFFTEKQTGFYIYGEPQLQVLLSANQELIERIDDVETINESSNQRDRYHSATFSTKVGFGGRLTLRSKLSVYLAYELILSPLRGFTKFGVFDRRSQGVKFGVNF